MNKRVARKVRRSMVAPAAKKGVQTAIGPTTLETSPQKNKVNIPFIITLVVVFTLGLGSGYLFWGGNTSAQTAETTQSDQLTRYVVDEGGNPSIGPADAPITIIEFSDYQCPYCQRWHEQVYSRLLEEYPDQVRIVYRDFPLGGHPQAIPAAEAANCANEQDAYWQYHDKLFSYEYNLGNDAYLAYASELGLDMTAFTDCIENEKYADEISSDIAYAQWLGVSSTPTFFINGIFIEGALPYESFKSVIDQELAGELQ